MTSTVLDVTVLLLCVSASVVALGASDAGGPEGPTPTDAADRLVTETTTVSYPDEDAPNGTRRVHATRAELLAVVVVRDGEGTFDHRVIETVRAMIGPRTRIDATVEPAVEADRDDGAGAATDGGAWTFAGSPAVRGEVASGPHSVAGEVVPTRGVSERDRGSGSGSSTGSVAVGPEPPRNADVDVTVVRQPIPSRLGGPRGERRSAEGVVRIVVRRW